MTRKEFSDEYAAYAKISKAKARRMCESMMEFLAKKIVEEDKIYFYGLGTFKKIIHKGRWINNFNDEGLMFLPDRTRVVFEACPDVMRRVWDYEINGYDPANDTTEPIMTDADFYASIEELIQERKQKKKEENGGDPS